MFARAAVTARLAAITKGGTVAACCAAETGAPPPAGGGAPEAMGGPRGPGGAPLTRPPNAAAWLEASSEWAAAALSHAAYGAAAVIIFSAEAPCHAPLATSAVLDANAAAASRNCSANPPQPAAAVSIGSDPAPLFSSAELISGGNAR
ncbi:hypothetical protein LRC484719_26950 [Mycobacterium riyadhense]